MASVLRSGRSRPARLAALTGLSLAVTVTACGPRSVAPVGAEPPGLVDGLEAARWIDLTHDFSEETIHWPTAEPFHLEIVSAERTPAGYYYAANNLCTAEHVGTHLDAPVHFAKGHWSTEQIPVDTLVGPAVVIDVSAQVGDDADFLIGPSDLERWQMAHGDIPDGAIVLFRTGWDARWPDAERYLGTSAVGDAAVADLRFPGLAPEAAGWIVERGTIDAIGIDTASIDYGRSETYEVHQRLFAADVPAFENVTNLDALPPTGAYVIGLPMRIRGGSGGPLRLVAVVP